MVSVVENNGAEDEADHEKCEGLQAIEIAQVVPPAEKKA
jgi:hypothetical protein